MSTGNRRRTRSDYIASLELRTSTWVQLLRYVRRTDIQVRILLCVLAALATYLVTLGWKPPFGYRSGYVPPRDISARVPFEVVDHEATWQQRDKARRNVRCYYANDRSPLEQQRQTLNNAITQIVAAESAAKVPEDAWNGFWPADDTDSQAGAGLAEERARLFAAAKAVLAKQEQQAALGAAVQRAFADFERDGLLDEARLPGEADGDQETIEVHPVGDELNHRALSIDDVLLLKATPRLKDRLAGELRTVLGEDENATEVIQRVTQRLTGNLQPTLSPNPTATDSIRRKALESVANVFKRYGPGDEHEPADLLVKGGRAIERGSPEYFLLGEEYQAAVAAMTPLDVLTYSLAKLGLFLAIYVFCGLYIFYREPDLLANLNRFSALLALFVVTVGLCWCGARDNWRVEIIPLLLMGMTMTIVYRQEMALLLSVAAALVVVLTLGQGIGEFVVLVATLAVTIQLTQRIRSRTKLMSVGLVGASIAFLTALGVGVLSGQPLTALLPSGLWPGVCTLFAAVLMTGLLPFVERIFGVQTDLKLLELGDAAHPLLQELVRRAPGTYNHSINVASIGEAAADAIGADGLLVRVGAYFHDIGKMLKPEYFIENQGQQANRHDSLVPAMSTLVIIAHVKDGADLARQHGLPDSIIDFILQHHGTTLVEFFYDQASQQSKRDPDGGVVDENSFRYPGPKPQTREAGVMMLADAVESASRTLVDPAPARIESLVHDIAMKRLEGGQFDECGLTFSELHTIENCLVKSLTAVYHGRVKYPDQRESA